MVERSTVRALATWAAALVGAVVALSAMGDGSGWATRADVQAPLRSIRAALAEGRYADADAMGANLYRSTSAAAGADSAATADARDAWVEAALRDGKAAVPAVVAAAEHAVAQRLRGGATDLEAVAALHNLAEVRAAHGQLGDSLQLHERGLAARRQRRPVEDVLLADSLDAVGLALIRLERFPDAAARLTESLRIREVHADSAPVALARTLELLALLFRWEGHFERSELPLARAVAIRERLTPNHPDYVSLLQLRGDVLFLRGDARGAQQMWSAALALGERTLGPSHAAIPEVLRRLGMVAYAQGDLATARRHRERALQVAEQALAPCDPALVGQIEAVAISLVGYEDYAAARRLLERSLTTTRSCAGTTRSAGTSDTRASTLVNLGDLSKAMGDWSGAEAAYREAAAEWSNGLGPGHPFVARALDALASVAAAQGQRTRALELYGQALAIERTALGASHPQVASALVNQARVLADAGNVSEALQQVGSALAIYAGAGASDEPDHLARALQLRGQLLGEQRRFHEARASLTRALVERERVFPPSHPLLAEARKELATVDFLRGDLQAAVEGAIRAEDTARSSARNTIRYLPERQAVRYAARRPRGLDLALSAAESPAVNRRAVLDAAIRSRGVVLDEMAARGRAVSDDADPDVQRLARAAAAAQQRFANLVVRSLDEAVPSGILDDARAQKDEAERALAERSATARAARARDEAGLGAVRTALPPGAALVSFIRYERVNSRRAASAVMSYAAFVTHASRDEPVFVPLGAASELEAAITAWRVAVTEGAGRVSAQASIHRAGEMLRERLWDPVATLTRGATAIFIVPDGAINLVNFDALPEGASSYLAETTVVIHYLPTERDLVTPALSSARERGSLLAVGGPDFGGEAAALPAGPVDRSGCDVLGGATFVDLPGARTEAAEISRYWTAHAGGATTLSGAEATESAVKHALPGHAIVHLATHAYVLGGDCGSPPKGVRAVGGLSRSTASALLTDDSPLLLSGLVLAGANVRARMAPEADDGLLTAQEVAALDLRGTEWAVLSACDTGLGAIRAGEGVFGLRRAFQIAGVRTVITSLWQVSDQATRAWMHVLYEARLVRRLGAGDAVRAANLAILRQRRAASDTTDPFSWAPFVAAGDWR